MLVRKTVDDVLSSFKKLVAELNKINERCNNDINDAEIAIKEATDKKAMAEVEKARTARVGAKLIELMS